MYPTIQYPGSVSRNSVAKQVRTELPHMNNSFMTINGERSPPFLRETSFERSTFMSQKTIDPNTMLPPCNLSMRNQAEKLKNELKFPTSPAFVSVYKMKKDIKL